MSRVEERRERERQRRRDRLGNIGMALLSFSLCCMIVYLWASARGYI